MHYWLSFFLLLSTTLTAQTIQTGIKSLDKRNMALTLLKMYDPTSYAMIEEYEAAPSTYQLGDEIIVIEEKESLVKYLEEDNYISVIDGLNQAVHEVAHGYANHMSYKYIQKSNELYDWNADHYAFFINGEVLIVPITETFPAYETRHLFSEELQTFRFPTYIAPSYRNLNTQANGIYGLLNELVAYYHGTKAAYEMYHYFDQYSQGTPEDWLVYLANVNSTYYAYLEFKLYIYKYLIYAKAYHPQVYEEVLNNVAFKRTYQLANRHFEKLIQDYFIQKSRIVKQLQKANYKVTEDNEYIIIRGKDYASGRGNFLKTYKTLKKELDKNTYKAIEMVLSE
ncbi:MAG: hypothetical protein ACFB0B_20655 [Thermonemataceae bacterium]|mgnify:CR=1 FL=1